MPKIPDFCNPEKAPLEAVAELKVEGSNSVVGVFPVSVSEKGMLVKGLKGLKLGESVEFNFLVGEGEKLDGKGIVLYVPSSEDTPYYEGIGIQFIKLSPRTRKMLEDHLAIYRKTYGIPTTDSISVDKKKDRETEVVTPKHKETQVSKGAEKVAEQAIAAADSKDKKGFFGSLLTIVAVAGLVAAGFGYVYYNSLLELLNGKNKKDLSSKTTFEQPSLDPTREDESIDYVDSKTAESSIDKENIFDKEDEEVFVEEEKEEVDNEGVENKVDPVDKVTTDKNTPADILGMDTKQQEVPLYSEPFKYIKEFEWSYEDGSTIFKFVSDGKVSEERIRYSKLDGNNPRILFQIKDVEGPREPLALDVETEHVVKVRTGFDSGRVWQLYVVLDLANEYVEVDTLEAKDNYYLVKLKIPVE